MKSWALPVAVAALAVTGCQSLEDCAKETFSKEFSCPAGSIKVAVRPDLNAADLKYGPPEEPPKEVKDDPARYRVWKENNGANHPNRKFTAGHEVWEAKGCDHEGLYECYHPSSTTQNNTNPGTNCEKLNPPAAKEPAKPDSATVR